jgi:hypothetical protein
MRLDGTPMFGIGPHLVCAEIAKEWVHDDRIICKVSAVMTRKSSKTARRDGCSCAVAWIQLNSIVSSSAPAIRS